MFGYICGGRPVETGISQVEPTKYVFTVSDAGKINYIALFVLPGAQIPLEASAAVYAKLPNKQEFQLLGALSNSKQSAIFKLNMGAGAGVYNDVDAMMDDDEEGAANSEAEIVFGISLEPVEQVEQYLSMQRMTATRQTKAIAAAPLVSPSVVPQSVNDVASMANKIVSHAYNFLASFVDPQGKVPIKAFDDWWAKFRSRLSADPEFLKTIDSSSS